MPTTSLSQPNALIILSEKKRIIETKDHCSVFSSEYEWTTSEIYALANELKGSPNFQTIEIWRGVYTNPAWIQFLHRVLNTIPLNAVRIVNVLNETTVSDDFLLELFDQLKINETVETLEISYPLTQDVVGHLAEVLKVNVTLQNVILRLSNLNADAIQILGSSLCANKKSKVRSLTLNGNPIGDESSITFENILTHCKSLQNLNLVDTGIDTKTITTLLSAAGKSSLISLSVYGNHFGDESLKALADILFADRVDIEIIVSAENNFSDEAIKHYLSCFAQNTSVLKNPISFAQKYSSYSQIIENRNWNMFNNGILKLQTNYTLSAVALYQAHYNLHVLFSLVTKQLLNHILSFLIPVTIKVAQHNDIIASNILNKRWNTSRWITTQNPCSKAKKIELKFFSKWSDPKKYNEREKPLSVIEKIRNTSATNAILQAHYFDFSIAEALSFALQANIYLTHLTISFCHLDDGEFDMIATALLSRVISLINLNLDFNNLGINSIQHFKNLIDNKKVTHVMLYQNEGITKNEEALLDLTNFANTHDAYIHIEEPRKRSYKGFFSSESSMEVTNDVNVAHSGYFSI